MKVVQRFVALIHPHEYTPTVADHEQRLIQLAARWRAANAAGHRSDAQWYALLYEDLACSLERDAWTDDCLPATAQLPPAVRADSRVFDRGCRALGHLAMYWRGARTPDEAAAYVAQYHAVVACLEALGWMGGGLGADEELPAHLMPPVLQVVLPPLAPLPDA